MMPIESIYELKAAVLDLQRHLNEKKPVVYHRAYERYEKLVDRFFKENINIAASERQSSCLHDVDYFLSLLDSTAEYYYLHQDDIEA